MKLKLAVSRINCMWFIRILRKIDVTLFFWSAPCSVDLIINTSPPHTAINIKSIRTAFVLGSGQ